MLNPIQITSQNIFKELSTASVNWLLANVGDKIRIETTFKIENVVLSDSDAPWILNKTDGLIGAGWVYDPNSQFANFAIGDAVKVWNYSTPVTMDAGDFTIIDKQGNGLIQLDHAIPTIGNNISHPSISISNKTPITAIKYHYNFIKNNSSPSFISAVDNVSDQMFYIQYKLASDVASSNMIASGGYEWQDGHSNGGTPVIATEYDYGFSDVRPCTIVGVAIDAGGSDGIYKSTFKITHYTKITPFLLYQQAIPPYQGANCLKLITQIEALELFTNPNFLQSEVFTPFLGNTGWYGSNFATGNTNYSISNLVYTNSGATQDIQLDATETTIEFDVVNTVDTPFAAGTKYTIAFHKIPNDPSEYIGTGKLMDINFLYDKLFANTVGGSVYNGQNYGGTYQILKGYAAAVTSTSILHIKVGVKMASAVISSFLLSGNPQYFMSIAIRKYTLATNVGDDVTLEIGQGGFSIVSSDPTMIVFEPKNVILRHPESDPATEGIMYPTGVNVFPEDELAGCSQFYIESSGRTTDTIKLTSVKCEIICTNGTNIFTLDELSVALSGYPNIGYTQVFDSVFADQFHIPTAETVRKYFEVKRRTDLDSGTRFYFSANYPVLFRWETWVAALGIDSTFLDTSLPNNGFNEWWFRYAGSGYTLYYQLTVNATKNGVPQQYHSKQPLTPHDYASNSTDYPVIKTIDTYDSTNGNHLTVSGVEYILGYADTQIFAVFKNVTAPHPTSGDHPNWTGSVVEIGIEAFESGGVSGKRRFSSKWAADSDTWFKPIPTMAGVKKVYLSCISDGSTFHTITATCLIDYTQLPANVSAFKITARIYDNVAGTYQEECITQKVIIIPANPTPQTNTPNIPNSSLNECCSDCSINVLADNSGLPLQNDISGRLFWFDSFITGATLDLQKWVGSAFTTVATNITAVTTYGVGTSFNSFVNQEGQNLVGIQLDWAKIINLGGNFGIGTYRIKVNSTIPVFGNQISYDLQFCLKTYSDVLADRTVRLEYWSNGITGDISDDTKFKDYGNINWYNSFRLRGYFGYPKGSYKEESIQYNTGEIKYVEDDQTPVYLLRLEMISFFIHEILRTDFMMADVMAITDYNSANNGTYIQKFVRKNSGYEPQWYELQSNLASIDLQFTPAFNRNRKLRS